MKYFINKSFKLAVIPLLIAISIFIFFYMYGDYLNLGSTKYGRDAQYGVYILLVITFFKFILDFYLIYIKRAHVEITDKGILDKTQLIHENFYAWSEIINIKVVTGSLCDGLEVVSKIKVLSDSSSYSSYDTAIIKELKISNREKPKIRAIFKKYLQVESSPKSLK